ncbi:FN3 associated domain-containing protein [Ferruginibacter albus]|uniref:FN3 associated domain-containing protein n=1 Tax=Ferruginibacter albus TaxID=2875540 RepID=UPI001CC6529F|nr:FN3 associated domain-containing protein [Ferruginibacter albus]UAY53533.1 chitobiase/beta-hexosaminidase C-terminal domain-containing protein [Ferruginibacter albus]
MKIFRNYYTSPQQKWQAVLFNWCIAFNCLLIFLLLFEDRLHVPVFLQVFGRAHPLVLHFPIVLLLVAFIAETVIASHKENIFRNAANLILLSASFTAVIAALMGLFLSREQGYTGSGIAVHKWLGIACSLVSAGWYGCRNYIRRSKILAISLGSCISVLLLITGHKGGDITHGEGFLLAPYHTGDAQPKVALQDALIFQHLVKPIFESKCLSCHNSNKAKGDLVMETQELLLKGGKSGKLWDTTAAGLGLMLHRIHLPLEDKEHMPPGGKTQLTDEELRILYLWIKGGASFTKKVTDLSPGDSLRMIAASVFKNDDEDKYDFAAADEKLISTLNTAYRVVEPIATGSPALTVSFFGIAQFKNDQVKELDKIKNNIVSLQLNKMPVTDEDLKVIGGFTNLRDLNLSFTAVKGDGLKYLSTLQQLQHLSLSGTAVSISSLKALSQLKKLRSLEIWNTTITTKDLATVKANFSKTNIDLGYDGDTVIAKLSNPIIDDHKKIFASSISITLKSPVRAALIHYTIDGTQPDSLSPVYKEPIVFTKTSSIAAKAYLKGWINSDVVTANFYKDSIKIDSIQLVTQPNPQYISNAQGGKSFIDGMTGNPAFFSTPEWVGYKDNVLEAYLFFNTPQNVHSIGFSVLMDIGNYILPPQKIEIWGGDNAHSLKLLTRTTPGQPAVASPAYSKAFTVDFPIRKLKVIKVVAIPVSQLPEILHDKKEKGWIFLDEIMVN